MSKKKIILENNLSIGDEEPIFFIAEIGINHNGNIEIAKRLIDAAFATQWHCVKFQKRTPEICVPEHQKNLMRDTPWGQMTYLDYRFKVEFEKKEYDYINSYCNEKPILWTASVWDTKSLEFLLTYNIPFIKIPSAKITDMELLTKSAQSGKPVFISTGMSTYEEIDAAVNILEKHSKNGYVLFYTNSTYPTPPEDLNLRLISELKKRYDCIIGYSGHEYDLEPSVIAATLGARVIERHITLDHTLWGSDQSASLEIHAMDLLRKRIKDLDTILGDGIKRISEKEMAVKKKLRG
ncbi:N-acetylneuraminate synthase family protein [Treponema primitia]|uniref:N-acetylneuraminate synthase family protein n=1 Tax=Treponema primitia TaxID=88058 RepID=UPI003980DBD5